jgi:hypothetical protein
MKKTLILGLLIVPIIAGCAALSERVAPAGRMAEDAGFNAALITRPNPQLPNVFIGEGDGIVVDQEPIRLSRRDIGPDGRVHIVWALDADSRFTFPRDGIVVGQIVGKPPRNLECNVRGPKRKVFVCSFVPAGKFQFKYTINALDGDRRLPALDPNFYGDF